MIARFAGPIPTRSRATAHDGIVYAVATAKNKAAPLYEQTKDALAQIDSTLAEAGSNKSRILRATVYITDMSRKPEMDRAWDEWVDRANPPQRACIGVTLADRDLVEILITAVQDK
ncbi:MAG: RidA family protein [Hyphomicrobiaceae bacterium]